MKHILIIMVLFLALRSYAIENSISVTFKKAGDLFESANKAALVDPDKATRLYQEAASLYTRLTEQATPTAALHMNAGNAWFRACDNGRALLHYHRGLALDPGNSDLLHNLRYVRSRCTDEFPQSRWRRILNSLIFWRNWPPRTLLIVFGIVYGIPWLLMAVNLFKRKRILNLASIALWVVSVILLATLILGHFRVFDQVDGVVIAKQAIAYQGNGYIYEPAFTTPLHAGTEVSLIEVRNDWYHVKVPGGSTCWLSSQALALIRQ